MISSVNHSFFAFYTTNPIAFVFYEGLNVNRDYYSMYVANSDGVPCSCEIYSQSLCASVYVFMFHTCAHSYTIIIYYDLQT